MVPSRCSEEKEPQREPRKRTRNLGVIRLRSCIPLNLLSYSSPDSPKKSKSKLGGLFSKKKKDSGGGKEAEVVEEEKADDDYYYNL